MKKLLLVVLTASAIGNSACARNREIVHVDSGVSIAYQLLNFNYVEPSDTCALGVCSNATSSGYFDRESGNINGARLSASQLDLGGHLYGRIAYGRAQGYVQYQGYSQAGTPISNGVSAANMADYSLRLGSAFSSGRVMAIPFVQYGRHFWNRVVGVGTSTSYEEDYQNQYIGFGALFQVAMTRILVGSLYAMAGQTLNPSIRVPSLGFAQPLGTAPLVKAGVLLNLRLSRIFGLYAGVRYTRFSYGQSPPQQSGPYTVMEPASNTVMTSYEGGLRLFF